MQSPGLLDHVGDLITHGRLHLAGQAEAGDAADQGVLDGHEQGVQ
jgi:hypothetical protein